MLARRPIVVATCRSAYFCTLSKITSRGRRKSDIDKSGFSLFSVRGKRCRMYISSNVKDKPSTFQRDSVIMRLVRGFVRTKFPRRATVHVVGSTVILRKSHRSCSALSFVSLSLCDKRVAVAGVNTTTSFLGRGSQIRYLQTSALPTKISTSYAKSIVREGLARKSFLIVIASNILRCLRIGGPRRGLTRVVGRVGARGTNAFTRGLVRRIVLFAKKRTLSSVAVIMDKV